MHIASMNRSATGWIGSSSANARPARRREWRLIVRVYWHTTTTISMNYRSPKQTKSTTVRQDTKKASRIDAVREYSLQQR